MTTNVQKILVVAEQLSPFEQLEIIQVLSQSLQRHYRSNTLSSEPDNIPDGIHRAARIKDLSDHIAEFWPSDETADEITSFIAQQRAADRTSDL